MPPELDLKNGYGSSLEKPLDVLVVGGGPAGTATAFRAKELGLSALVVELDDLLMRIRDYAKDKPILPTHLGGGKLRFPAGGELIGLLPFEPIDKDEMCARWKGFYQAHQVAHVVGVEVMGLERASNGAWGVAIWCKRENAEGRCYARHVVLAMGRGVPRTFDIPGDVDGIAFRLDDARKYVGEPACIVGGGTSAAEAVIAISNAKAEAGDPSTVHWCHRGEKMPDVVRALAERLFDASMGNGNIRYHPRSEPAAIVRGDDKKEYFSVRTDRRRIDGRPAETTHLEFPKGRCIACIGADIPEKFLKSIGINLVVGGPNNKKMLCVTPRRESVLENVYLVGDILSMAHLETEDFKADPSTFREVPRAGNIKKSLHDGVLVAQVIAEKLKGNPKPVVEVREIATGETAPGEDLRKLTREPRDEAPPDKSLDPQLGAPKTAGSLVRMGAENVETDEYAVKANGVTTIGRVECDITFPNDTMLSEHHASIAHGPTGCFLRDDGSSTGVFLKVPEARWIDLELPALVRAGRQYIRFMEAGGKYTLVHFSLDGKERGRHAIEQKLVLGRDAPSFVLDAQDKTLSRTHLGVAVEEGAFRLRDMGSMNGTFLKVESGSRLQAGDEFRIGHERLVLKQLPAVGPEPEPEVSKRAQQPEQVPQRKEAKTVDAGVLVSSEPSISIPALGKTIPVQRNQTILEALLAHKIAIDWECGRGGCGKDSIRILEGQQNLNPCGENEAQTLAFDDLEPGPCRLSCVAKPKGPVVIEVIKKT